MNNHFFDFFLEVSKGLAPDHFAVNKYGRNGDIGTASVPEAVYAFGGEYSFPANAGHVDISSSSTQDDYNLVGATGALQIAIEGLDADYNQIKEVVRLTGNVVNRTQKQYIRVNRAYIISAGTGLTNSGDINGRHQEGMTVFSISREKGQTEQCVYTIPAGHKGYLLDFFGSISKAGNNRTATLELIFSELGLKDDLVTPTTKRVIKTKQELTLQSTGATSYNKFYALPIPIKEKTDVYVNVNSVSSNNTEVFANLGIIVEKQTSV